MTRSRMRAALVVIVGIALAIPPVYVLQEWPRLTREPMPAPEFELPELAAFDVIEFDEHHLRRHLLGHSEARVVERYGRPSQSFDGHYGMPDLTVQREYSDATSAVYERASGSLYLSYCKQDGKMVWFSAFWLPKGGVF